MTSFQSEYFFNDEDEIFPCESPPKAGSSSGTGSRTDSPKTVPDEIGPFRLGPVLGSGSTGLVRLGTHKETGFQVAFKIIEKQPLESKPAPWAKVKREIAVLKLIDHPNILKLYDVLETSDRLYLVLEWIKGGELFDFVIKRGKLDKELALRLLAQVISGLECCHANSICHRDLKLENLLLDEKENIKIADFGLAQCMKGGELLKTGCGSPHYASPEILLGQQYDGKKTDVWSLGVILYTLVAGRLPFDDPSLPVLLKKIIKGHYEMPMSIPFDLSDLIRRMLVLDPKKRIRMEDIRSHPCFQGYAFAAPSPQPSLKRTLNISITPETIDESILLDLESLGWGNKDEIRLKLLAPPSADPNAPNLERSFYSLLIERKASRLLGLARLSPKVKTRTLAAREPLSASDKILSVSAPTSPALTGLSLNDRNTGSVPSSPLEPKRPSFLRLESDSSTAAPGSPIALTESPVPQKRRVNGLPPSALSPGPVSPTPPSTDSPNAAMSGRFRTVVAARSSRRATIDSPSGMTRPLSPALHIAAANNASGRASPSGSHQTSESPRPIRVAVRPRDESPKPPAASPQSASNPTGNTQHAQNQNPSFSTPSPFRRLTMPTPSNGQAKDMSLASPPQSAGSHRRPLSFNNPHVQHELDTTMVEHSLEDMAISPPAASVSIGSTYQPTQNPFVAPTDAASPASPPAHNRSASLSATPQRLLPELRTTAGKSTAGRKHHLSPDKNARRMTIGSVSSDTGSSPSRLDFTRTSRDDTSSPSGSPQRVVKEHRVSGSPKMSWFRRIFARRPSLDVVNIADRERKAGSRSESPAGSPRVPIRISAGRSPIQNGFSSIDGGAKLAFGSPQRAEQREREKTPSPAPHSRRRSLSAAEYARAAGELSVTAGSAAAPSSLPSHDATTPAIGSPPHRVKLPEIEKGSPHREAVPAVCF